MRTYHREDDNVVRVDTRIFPARVDFADILEAVEVSPDEFADPPWETCEGLDHKRDRQGVIHLPWDTALETYYRDRGASKQVAKELTARSLAYRREYLAGIYAHGYEVWQVCGTYHGFDDSVCGVDDYDYAAGECSADVALEVAGQLQDAGFDITGMPDTTALYRENRAYHLRRNVHLFDHS